MPKERNGQRITLSICIKVSTNFLVRAQRSASKNYIPKMFRADRFSVVLSSLVPLDAPGHLPVGVDVDGLLDDDAVLVDDGQVVPGRGAAVAEEADAEAALDRGHGVFLAQLTEVSLGQGLPEKTKRGCYRREDTDTRCKRFT